MPQFKASSEREQPFCFAQQSLRIVMTYWMTLPMVGMPVNVKEARDV